ncbi:MAG: NAD(+) ADP-ribosyltransferase [Hydrogenophaga sp.]|nr:NAD(+) ADP-ribosyltransferase [Hydrogenophaga sp.]
MDDEPVQPHRWYSTNLVGVPARVLAGTAFNAHPVPLSIAGTRESHPGLFNLLGRSQSLSDAAEVFVHYLDIAFGLRAPAAHEAVTLDPAERRRWRSSWRKLLQAWGMDNASPAGAVLKGWVESRFGLVPTHHRQPLQRFPSPGWVTYLEEKTFSRLHNNNIHQQLDLLFEFCQWALQRFGLPGHADAGASHVRLWRGSTHCEEQLVDGSLRGRHCTVRLNNLVSFSLSQEDAGCFGDWVFEARVPASKLLVFPGLLTGQVLQGEQEVLALGGDYEVVARYE